MRPLRAKPHTPVNPGGRASSSLGQSTPVEPGNHPKGRTLSPYFSTFPRLCPWKKGKAASKWEMKEVNYKSETGDGGFRAEVYFEERMKTIVQHSGQKILFLN